MVDSSPNAGHAAGGFRPDAEAPPLSWQTLKAALAPSEEQARRLVRSILSFHEAWTRVLFEDGAGGEVSPARATVRRIREDGALTESAFVPAALWLVNEGDEQNLYAAHRDALRAQETTFRAAFRELLDDGQRAAFDRIAARPLWHLDVGYWPHFQRLGELYWSESCLEGGVPANGAHSMLGAGSAAVDKADLVRGRFCPRPFDYAQVDPDGHVFGCCPSMLFKSFGNLRTQGFMEAWNSETAQAVRASILDGSYRYCSERACPDIQGGRLSKNEDVTDPEHRAYIEQRTVLLPRGPRHINMAYDQTCNLRCPSCRSDMIVAQGETAERIREIHVIVLGEHLRDARRLVITGSGDPFASRFYLNFLQTFNPADAPHLRIQLSTNGLLLNERMWDSICNEAIDEIDLSVDAATETTYKANRGGNFGKLCRNLDFIGGLRRTGRIRRFQLLFVVQANNYAEMPAFVRLGLRVHADRIVFKQLQNWGSWTFPEYGNRAIQDPGHPEFDAFRKMLRSPELQHPKADLFDLQHLLPRDGQGASGPSALASPDPAYARRLAEALMRDLGGETPLTRLVRQYDGIAAAPLLAEAEARACHPEGALVSPEDTEALVALLEGNGNRAETQGNGAEYGGCPASRLVAAAVAALAAGPAAAASASDWLRFRERLALDDRQAVLALGELQALKRATAELVQRQDSTGGAAPLSVLAKGGEGALQEYVLRLGRARPADGTETYLKAIYRLERQCEQALRALLRPEQIRALEAWGPRLGEVRLSKDPFAEALRRFRQAAGQ